jgi:mono/diheme cytochrome c family protein
MKIILFSSGAVICFIMACSSPEVKSPPRPTPSAPVQAVDNGRSIFEEKCTACHGADGTAGIVNAANLQTSKLDTVSVLQIITHGKNSMAAFKDQLSPGEIEQVAHYVFTLRKQ